MKVTVRCDCLLMQRSLELFLDEYLVDKHECEVIITDNKKTTFEPNFFIGNDSPYLSVPFSKADLMASLEEYHFMLLNSANSNEPQESLEGQIAQICDEFKAKLIKTIKDYHG